MQNVTPPMRQCTVRKPDDQGAIVLKLDHGGQTEPRPVTIPDDCVMTGESDDSPQATDALSNKSVDKDKSPFYSQRSDGTYYLSGLD